MTDSFSRYKIGDVARILGISTDLIRYYEKKGVVTPKKDEYNRYRYYDAWDVNFLIDCLWYKRMGFSIEEIGHMTTAESFDYLLERMTDQSETLAEQLRYQSMLLERMQALTQGLSEIRKHLGVCDIRDSKEFVYYLNRKNNQYERTAATLKLNGQWNGAMPFARRCFLIEPDALAGENNDFSWGYSMNMDYAKLLNINVKPPVRVFPAKKCVHAAFTSHGKEGFTARHMDFMQDFANNRRLKPEGPAFGILVCSIPEDGRITGYFEAWLPVTE